MKKILVVWGNWGPYHYARFDALHKLGTSRGFRVRGVELFPTSGYYNWRTDIDHPAVDHLDLGSIETEFNLWRLITRLVPYLWKLRPHVILVPSYWHWSVFLNLTGRLFAARIIMMNESHAGTERARGWKRGIKKAIVRRFDSALVGGNPHRRHFANLGLPESHIHLGYDAVDNSWFSQKSDHVRSAAAEYREKFQLPEHYFLSLGRMVKKKNLRILIEAFALFAHRNPELPHDLVFVGSGEEEEALKKLCRKRKLLVTDHAFSETGRTFLNDQSLSGPKKPAPPARMPTVHFYGFRQIDENPIFYALTTAFILPSLYEEWGLVINEAMACRLPVLASKTLGCTEDLVEHGLNGFTFDPRSAGDLAEYLKAVTDPEIARRMGTESAERIKNWGCDRFATGAMAAVITALERDAGKALQTDSELSKNESLTSP